jgi:predicted ATPase
MSILLEPLSVEDTSLLATNLASGQLPEEVEARVTQAAAGVPLFVEEFVRMLIDDGFLTRIGDRWASTKDLASMPVPATIHALLTARLEMLADHNRTILQRASVVGSVFNEDEVAELLPAAERPLLDERLGELVHTDLIAHDHRSFAERDTFRFRHDLKGLGCRVEGLGSVHPQDKVGGALHRPVEVAGRSAGSGFVWWGGEACAGMTQHPQVQPL